jgi:hypothetical protein
MPFTDECLTSFLERRWSECLVHLESRVQSQALHASGYILETHLLSAILNLILHIVELLPHIEQTRSGQRRRGFLGRKLIPHVIELLPHIE